jgi:hypothetical protein
MGSVNYSPGYRKNNSIYKIIVYYIYQLQVLTYPHHFFTYHFGHT